MHEDSDSKEGVAGYLECNRGLSFVARAQGRVVGAVLCGHDGWRGYLHHLAVAETHRRKGIGRALVERVIGKLELLGIRKCHIFLFGDNVAARKFWQRTGWIKQVGLTIMSKNIGPNG